MARIYYISGLKQKIGMQFAGQEITASSTPALDTWGWADYWGCTEWKAWHIELLKQMSAKQAALIFTHAWNQQDSFANPYNWCKYNSDFRNYMRANGIDIDSIASAIIMPMFDAAGNLSQGAGDIVSNTSNAASAISKLIKPVGFIALAGAAYWGYKNFLENEKR